MNEQTNEQEISLRKLLYRILREWRKCLIIAFWGAVIIGGGNQVLKESQISTPEKLESAKLDYERKLAVYRSEGENLQYAIENLEEMQAQQEEYNEKSILMQIDPFRKYNTSAQFYVATDYQIVPELTYQNIDLSSRILRSYVNYMNNDMYQYIQDHLTEEIELRYLQEVISVAADYDNSMVTLNVQGVDEQWCEKVLGYAIEGLYARQEDIQTAIGEHELNLVSQSTYETADVSLDNWQKDNQQYALELNVSIKEKLDELTAWRLAAEPEKEFELGAIVKDSAKKAIIGFIVAGALVVAVIALCYILSDKVQDAKDLKSRFGLRMIAEIPEVHKKRIGAGIDKVFAHMCGLTLLESSAEQLIEVAAQSIRAELAVRRENADSRKQKLVFTGSIGNEEIQKLLSNMKWESEFSVNSVPNILCDPSAIPAMMDADYVILVEKQEESRYSQIELELEKLAAWKKEVLGVIVLGADGIPA